MDLLSLLGTLFKTIIFVYKYKPPQIFFHFEDIWKVIDRRVKQPDGARPGARANPEKKSRPQPEVRSQADGKCFEIDIFRDWCKSCGICAAFCPRECIRLDDEGVPTNVDPGRCTGCGWCELHCPDFAISVHEKDHKARMEDE